MQLVDEDATQYICTLASNTSLYSEKLSPKNLSLMSTTLQNSEPGESSFPSSRLGVEVSQVTDE